MNVHHFDCLCGFAFTDPLLDRKKTCLLLFNGFSDCLLPLKQPSWLCHQLLDAGRRFERKWTGSACRYFSSTCCRFSVQSCQSLLLCVCWDFSCQLILLPINTPLLLLTVWILSRISCFLFSLSFIEPTPCSFGISIWNCVDWTWRLFTESEQHTARCVYGRLCWLLGSSVFLWKRLLQLWRKSGPLSAAPAPPRHCSFKGPSAGRTCCQSQGFASNRSTTGCWWSLSACSAWPETITMKNKAGLMKLGWKNILKQAKKQARFTVFTRKATSIGKTNKPQSRTGKT